MAEDIIFGKRPLKFSDLSLYPWKFQTKWSSTPGKSTKLCYIHWNFQSQKPRPMEIPHDLFCILYYPRKLHFFLYWPQEFSHSTYSVPLEISCPQPPCLHFSGIALYLGTSYLASCLNWILLNKNIALSHPGCFESRIVTAQLAC